MKTITLELSNIETVRALHIYLQYMLDFPAYYGRNLDALYDCLTDIGEDARLIVRAQGVRGELTAYLPRLMKVLTDAAEYNPHLTVCPD